MFISAHNLNGTIFVHNSLVSRLHPLTLFILSKRITRIFVRTPRPILSNHQTTTHIKFPCGTPGNHSTRLQVHDAMLASRENMSRRNSLGRSIWNLIVPGHNRGSAFSHTISIGYFCRISEIFHNSCNGGGRDGCRPQNDKPHTRSISFRKIGMID